MPSSQDATPDDRSDPDAATRPVADGGMSLRVLSRSRAGTRLDRYLVGDVIGEGGMGVVHRAHDPALDRELAIKLVRTRSDGVASARLVLEAKAMAALAHPNVLPVYDVGTVDDEVYFAMELVHGETLRAWMQRGGHDWRAALDLMLAAGRGLAAAHAAGIVHRDFKPSNVLLADDGRVLVTDFGLARASATPAGGGSPRAASSWPSGESSELTLHGEVIGTPAYMPPEMLSERPTTTASDQFAFSVALYEALYGERPWTASELAAAASRDRALAVPAPRRRRGVPRRVHAAIVRGLAWDPTERWPSTTAMLDVLVAAARPRSRLFGIVASASMLAGVIALVDRDDPCGGGHAQLAGVWDVTRRDAAVAALHPVHGGAEPERRVLADLDAHAEEWARVHDRLCSAVTDGTAWADDPRRACLSERRARLGTTVDVIIDGDAHGRALAAVAALPHAEACADADGRSSGAADPRERSRLREQFGAASALFALGDYDATIRSARDLAVAAERLGEPALQAEAESLRGSALSELDDDRPAAEALERAFFLASEAGDDIVARDAAARLGFVIGGRLSDPASGLRWLDHARAIAARLPDDALASATLANNTGAIAREHGNYDEALAQFERALELRRSVISEDDVQIANVLLNLSNVLGDVGRNAEARVAATRAIELWTAALGPRHPDVMRGIANLGVIEHDDGKFDTALERYEEALALCEAMLGGELPCVRIHVAMGNVLWRLGRLDEALDHNHRALAINERHYGPNDSISATVRANIGNVLDDRGDHAAAIEQWTSARVVFENTLGPDHVNVGMILTNLGNARDTLGDHAGALADLQRARDVLTRALGPTHGHLGTIAHDLAIVHTGLGRLDLAEDNFREALALREGALPPEHPEIADTLVGLADVLVNRGKATEAVALLERATAILDAAEVDNDDRNAARTALALARAATGQG